MKSKNKKPPHKENTIYFIILRLVCPFIVSIIRNRWPTRCNFLVYLFAPNQLYMFSATLSPIIRSPWLYLQLLIQSTYVAVGRYHGRDEFHLVHDTIRQQYQWTISEAVNTVKCSWWWAKTSPEIFRADCIQINKLKICILFVIDYELFVLLICGCFLICLEKCGFGSLGCNKDETMLV